MSRSITRTGRQRTTLAAGSGVAADVLCDPAAVTALLGDLLDQRRSKSGPPARWVVPAIRIGLASFETTLVPVFERSGDDVRIEANTTPGSDARAGVVMDMATASLGPDRCRLTTIWHLELAVPLPRAALRLAGPTLDRTVARTVHRIMDRTEAAVLEARRG